MDDTVAYAELMLHIEKHVRIDASIEIVFETLIDQMGPEADFPDGRKMDLKFEAWPGGRWFRDLGNNTGHLWGHVQVIKPPSLLEITGPMMMSYPAVNHLQYRLTPDGDGTKLTLNHRGMGDISVEHRTGLSAGWQYILESIKKRAQK